MAAPGASAPFLDTNILLYLVSRDSRKADRAEALLMDGAIINVQVLNEFASVARRKAAMTWDEIDEALGLIRQRCKVRPLSVAVHEQALVLVRQFSLAWYDALIVSAAIDAGSAILYSEDMQSGLEVTPTLTLLNPFIAA